VATLLLPRHAREGVRALYAFCRHADDIADSPVLTAEDKQATLARLHQALRSGTCPPDMPHWAAPYFQLARQHGWSLAHTEKLLEALMQDTWKKRIATEQELMGYSLYSAASVGRAVLDICTERFAEAEAADALCCALQVLNHLQDAKKDYETLRRVYLPEEWFEAEEATPQMLAAPVMEEKLRRVFTRGLDMADELLARANALPDSLQQRGVQMEAALALAWARRLSRALRKADPLAGRVRLPRHARVMGFCAALFHVLRMIGRDVGDALRRLGSSSRSSFFLPILLLPHAQRDGLLVLHAFCRQVDACADDPRLPAQEARLRLQLLRSEIDAIYALRHTSLRALRNVIHRHDIPREYFDALFEGVAMDMRGEMYKPPLARLLLYCDRVAAAPGRMALCLLGVGLREGESFARHLGIAMQLTNILRDAWDDLQQGRLYFPSEWLESLELDTAAGEPVFVNPAATHAVCRATAALAREHYALSQAALPWEDRRALSVALAMRALYLARLDTMEKDGWPALLRKTPRPPGLFAALRTARVIMREPEESLDLLHNS